MNQKKKLNPAIAALIVIVLVGIVASVVIVINNNDDKNTASTDTHNQTSQEHDHSHGATDPAASPASTDTSGYKDGTYRATGKYISPGGPQSIELSVTIKDGTITETSIATQPTDIESKEHQELFVDHYKTLIVGKKIGEVASLSRVAGSSLTSNGFNDALDQIKDNART